MINITKAQELVSEYFDGLIDWHKHVMRNAEKGAADLSPETVSKDPFIQLLAQNRSDKK